MADVDFSNAKIQPLSVTDSINPTAGAYFGAGSTNLYNSSWGVISTNASRQVLTDQSKQVVLLFQGTFTTSGTEFYLGVSYIDRNYGWRIYNISFSAGDTYMFKIRADLICQ